MIATTTQLNVGCMLLTAVDGEEGARLIRDRNYAAQEKFDGKRIILHATKAGVTGYNRKGLACQIPTGVIVTAKARVRLYGKFMLDGELVGENYIAFDLLEHDGTDHRSQPFVTRQNALTQIVAKSGPVRYGYTAITEKQKVALLTRLIEEKAEGIVFKKMYAPYFVGRARDQFKHKFYATASCVVTEINARRSVKVGLYMDGGKMRGVGNCSIASNKQMPDVGDVIEIRYLYAFRFGSLYQPVFLGRRDDLDPSECLHSQLKFKQDIP